MDQFEISSTTEKLMAQLKNARDEIANLRKQINSANHIHRKEIQLINDTLKNFKCQNCTASNETNATRNDSSTKEHTMDEMMMPVEEAPSDEFNFRTIGTVRSVFPDKRAVPRQANIADNIISRIELRKDIYTNPEQALETLEGFSHLWIIYYFHKNNSHIKPKISPPRLDGKKVGVFATRSPHRPNLIGLSLVRLNKIEGSVIYFYGNDMVDKTPVLDIKPYIPSYDSPLKEQDAQAKESPINEFDLREEPEGEEDDDSEDGACAAEPNPVNEVKVPKWINEKKLLTVLFTENATNQVQELGLTQMLIQKVLENDPRSVYVREKYLSQIYSFHIAGNNVMCKFDDKKGTVIVLQIRTLLNTNE